MKHASLCDIFTEKYSYSNAKRDAWHILFIVRQLATAAIYICMDIA